MLYKEIKRRFPSDIVNSSYTYEPSNRVRGDAYEEGMYTDEWGCMFQNVQRGLIGEVKIPLVQDLSGWEMTGPPYEQIPKDKKSAYGEISRFQESTDRFVLASICPRPWERIGKG